ncbi:MAG: hypothetical protein H6741_32200 [Alphaproteobacteria bacterium]|nr:hypothetical protein [Alphaproteobacteria bacterium]
MLLAALLSAPIFPQAHALSCADGPDTPLPVDGATGVPTDVLPRVSMQGSGLDVYALFLVDELGQEVPVTLEEVENPGSTNMVWIRPDAPLEADASYSIYASAEGDTWGDWTLSTFTTGDGPSEGMPVAPEISGVTRDKGRDVWGSWNWLDVDLRTEGPSSFVVELASDEGFSDAREVQLTHWDGGEGAIELYVGDGLCGGPIPLEDDERWVRVARVDYAGNVSDFGVAPKAVGCSSAPGSASGLAGLLGLVLVAGARRRRQ